MVFNSIDFFIFLPVVFILYWTIGIRSIRFRNGFLLLASYFFYGYWDWRFLGLIFLSSMIDYLVSIWLSGNREDRQRKMILMVSVFSNLAILGFFKYFNFFIENFAAAFSFFGYQLATERLSIILPVGISFYTFQTMSYTIDVYRGKISPERNLISFLTYVSFFPQLVAGPIERAGSLLPQFRTIAPFNYEQASDGIRQMTWGLLKKVVIADSLAGPVSQVFSNPSAYDSLTLILTAMLFLVQLYGDFSGYSDMAIGSARLFGFRLSRNFNFPLFADSIPDFWRRWHISLTNWFRDYVFIPMTSGRNRLTVKIPAVIILFVLIGFWHGPAWTFVVFGFVNALFFIPGYFPAGRLRLPGAMGASAFPGIPPIILVMFTFCLTAMLGILFRAGNLETVMAYYAGILMNHGAASGQLYSERVLLLTGGFLLIEFFRRDSHHVLEWKPGTLNRWVRWGFYMVLIAVIFLFHEDAKDYIYFQF
ncbi:MAG: MBOAT family protein [Bacteroidetes bacterium]|nr:MBOAT family protein [Bacteroidota bacterium]